MAGKKVPDFSGISAIHGGQMASVAYMEVFTAPPEGRPRSQAYRRISPERQRYLR
ncbi:hypothetical protein GCM10023342_11730 [Modicisalibacter zincidurans]|uniref:Uncharacterized protein n=1 Tax=Modicisalibacter zincidurans TaxID=1178777 RepID=A0ABP9R9B5_9GAMM